MSNWLDLPFSEQRLQTVSEGFGVAFRLMVAAVDGGDVQLLRDYDEQWATTVPQTDVGRLDYLGDLVAAEQSTLIAGAGNAAEERKREVRDAVRLLRAVYRFGLLAWILDGAEREGGSRERRVAAQTMAAHFGDAGVLGFVAGKAIAVSHDRRLAWWPLLVRPRADRTVVTSFVPALITAYLSLLMDLPEQPLLAEPWLEEYRVMLGDGISRAWPLNSEPSFWEGGGAATAVASDQSVGARRRHLVVALDSAVEELKQERAMRVTRAAILPARSDLFIAVTRAAWVQRRALGPALRALVDPSASSFTRRVVAGARARRLC